MTFRIVFIFFFYYLWNNRKFEDNFFQKLILFDCYRIKFESREREREKKVKGGEKGEF